MKGHMHLINVKGIFFSKDNSKFSNSHTSNKHALPYSIKDIIS